MVGMEASWTVIAVPEETHLENQLEEVQPLCR